MKLEMRFRFSLVIGCDIFRKKKRVQPFWDPPTLRRDFDA